MGAGVRYLQIELLSIGIVLTSDVPAHTWLSRRRYLHMSRLNDSTSYFEVVYTSEYEGTFEFSLVDPDGVIVDTLTLSKTSDLPSSYEHNLRVRSTTPLKLAKDGVYSVRTGARPASSGTIAVYTARLVVAQPNPTTTEEHRGLLVSSGASADDTSGISGCDIFRTRSTAYDPLMYLTAGAYDEGGGEKFVFPWFKYVAAEWPQLRYCQMEMCTDAFADMSYCALYHVDPVTGVQTLVPGSEVTHVTATDYEVAVGEPFSMAGQPDGYYAVRFKSSNGAANTFYTTAFLHLVSKADGISAKGRTYFRVGDGQKSRRKSIPVLDGPEMLFETCTFHNSGQPHTFLYDDGLLDIGLGSELAQSDINMDLAYTKGVFRSPDISPYFVDGNRYDGDNNSGIGTESWVNTAYDVPVGGCYRPPGGVIYEMSGKYYTDSGCTIRRVRVTPHLSVENLMLFFEYLEVICDRGLGLDGDEQGSDPRIMVQWSDDGGGKWSSERWLPLGKIGQRKMRAIVRAHGSARDRVYRLIYTDPAPIRIVDGFIRYKVGNLS